MRAGPAGFNQENQRQKPVYFCLVRHQLGEEFAQSDGFGTQITAQEILSGGGRVALVEDQVDHGEHRSEAVGEFRFARDPVRNPGRADLSFRSDEALGHRRLGDEEGPGDLLRLETAQ